MRLGVSIKLTPDLDDPRKQTTIYHTIIEAFKEAGWGYNTQFAAPDYEERVCVNFQHPTLLARIR